MTNRYLSFLREYSAPLLVMILGSLVTAAACVSTRRMAQERTELHAAADGAEYAQMLQQGVESYLHLSRDLAGFIAASGPPSEVNLDRYLRATRVMERHPGLRYIGYIPRVARTDADRLAPEAGRAGREPSVAPDPRYIYPRRYVFPRNRTSSRVDGMDFSTLPERWLAMQQARDSGEFTITSKHAFVTRLTANPKPIITAFLPIYDLNAPLSSVEERRAALRGFVFSVIMVEEMIDRVMGTGFKPLFDLEIYEGTVRRANLLYDGDGRSHLSEPRYASVLARQQVVALGNLDLHLLFAPTASYARRYQGGDEFTLVALGLIVSGALAYAAMGWTRRQRLRSLRHGQNIRFDAVFENHPSAVYSLDRAGRFLDANARAVKELKTDKASLIGSSIARFLPAESRQRALDCLALGLDENSVMFESAVIDGEGARIDLSVIVIPVRRDGMTISVLCIAENVTERKMREGQLKESQKMLRLVIDNIPQRVFWKDTALRFLGCNQAFCDDAGLAHPAEIVGKTDFDLPWKADAEGFRSDDRATLIRNAATIDYEEVHRREDGDERWLRTSKIPLSDFEGRTVGLLCMYEDITARKTMERQLKELAHYDSLTGLANRPFFVHQVEHAVTRARRHGSEFALMYLDLDEFKSINDTMGHDAGDRLLQGFAQRLLDQVRDTDIVARLGGDEFAVLLEDLADREAAEQVACKLLAALKVPLAVEDTALVIGTSIGIAFSGAEPSVEDVIRRADQAMYQAKRGGRNRFAVDAAAERSQMPVAAVRIMLN